MFTLVLFVALLAGQYSITHLWKQRKGKVHFVPDVHNSGWARTTDGRIELRLGGVLTFTGDATLIVLKAFLRGTEPTTDMMAQVSLPDGSGRLTMVPQLHLPANEPAQVFINLLLKPTSWLTRMLSWFREGQPYPGRVILRDNHNTDFVLDRVTFSYIGRK